MLTILFCCFRKTWPDFLRNSFVQKPTPEKRQQSSRVFNRINKNRMDRFCIKFRKSSIGQRNQLNAVHLLKVFVRSGKLEKQKFVFSSLVLEDARLEDGRVVLQGGSECNSVGFGDVNTSIELFDGCQEKLWDFDSFDANFRQIMTGSFAGLVDVAQFVKVFLHENGTREWDPLTAISFSPKNGRIMEKAFVEFLKWNQNIYKLQTSSFNIIWFSLWILICLDTLLVETLDLDMECFSSQSRQSRKSS